MSLSATDFDRRGLIGSAVGLVLLSHAADMPDPAHDSDRAPDPEWLTVSGVCTHASCAVTCGLGPYRGFSCFCHGSQYDVSGRVRRGPAKKNLAVVRHRRDGNQI